MSANEFEVAFDVTPALLGGSTALGLQVMIERLSLPVDCDLSESSLRWAIDTLQGDFKSLVVHPHQKRFAEFILWHTGYRKWTAVQLDAGLDEDAWIARGDDREVYSPGA